MVFQESVQAAPTSQVVARQLLADAVSTLEHLCTGREGKIVSEDAGWLLSRPLLRLLLWLLPVHVSAETPTQPTEPEPKSAASPSADWKQGFGVSYVRDVATVSLCIKSRCWLHTAWCVLSSIGVWWFPRWLPLTVMYDWRTAASTLAGVLAAPACWHSGQSDAYQRVRNEEDQWVNHQAGQPQRQGV
jgi:hypothetical protein